jgi:tetratricopeptide (TPR) repeat protein
MLDSPGRPAEALGLHQRALAIRERLVAENPTVTEHRSDLARSLVNIGDLLGDTGHPADALATLDRARATLEQLVAENPAVPAYRFALGGALNDLGAIEIGLRHWQRAREPLMQAVASLRRALEDMPDNPRYLHSLRLALGKLIRTHSALNEPSEAIRAAHESATIARGDPRELYNVACVLSRSMRLAPGPTRQSLADEAVLTLEKSIAAGWHDASLTCRDSDLNPLRNRDDFRRLLAGLLDRGFPADPFAR